MSVITIEDDADVSTLLTDESVEVVSTLLTDESVEVPKEKQRRKSVKDKNTERVLLKEKKESELELKNRALKSGFKLLEYAKEEKGRLSTNDIKDQVKRDPNYVKPLGLRAIVSQVNEEYGTDTVEKPLTKTTLMRYYNNDIKERKKVGAPPSIPLALLNTMRLHIKVLQLSKKGTASGKLIKAKLTAAAAGTEHEGFDSDWAWRRIRELYPEEVTPSSVSQQESIRNEWTTYTKINDWYDTNKKTLVESGLAIDLPSQLENGDVAEITIGEVEKRRIVNFDETDHSFSTICDKGGSRSVRWGDPKLAKGTEKSTRGARHTTGNFYIVVIYFICIFISNHILNPHLYDRYIRI